MGSQRAAGIELKHRSFVDGERRTPAYVAAVQALTALDDHDLASRAAAEATWRLRLEAWAQQRGVRLSQGHACIARLLGKRCPWTLQHVPPGHPPCQPPGVDHPRFWVKDGKPYAFTFEPYVLNLRTLRKLVDFCEQWGLDLTIEGWPTGHFPGATVWVELRPKAAIESEVETACS